ncbi:hypothetical protein AG1IA_09163 [Rhizoctonia solani AG-1 IA]|uniref:Uncharacterized protein n=1 Tax=Thanatephorus cucumeris (strain AG1-IA) TaxID=983506 RepID=L8WF70_THACA|nr:hypothetical protein AG1IA_09163 [Rhizoctonia solani AG-1 IA]
MIRCRKHSRGLLKSCNRKCPIMFLLAKIKVLLRITDSRNSEIAHKGIPNVGRWQIISVGGHLVRYREKLPRASLFPQNSMVVVIVNEGEGSTEEEGSGSPSSSPSASRIREAPKPGPVPRQWIRSVSPRPWTPVFDINFSQLLVNLVQSILTHNLPLPKAIDPAS